MSASKSSNMGSEEELEDDLLECIMCRNETLVDFLRRHIKFHHMIQEEDIIEKMYYMHFPTEKNTIETQTSVSWVQDMHTLGEAVGQIETHFEDNTSRYNDKTTGTLKLKLKKIKTANGKHYSEVKEGKEKKVESIKLVKTNADEITHRKVKIEMSTQVPQTTSERAVAVIKHVNKVETPHLPLVPKSKTLPSNMQNPHLKNETNIMVDKETSPPPKAPKTKVVEDKRSAAPSPLNTLLNSGAISIIKLNEKPKSKLLGPKCVRRKMGNYESDSSVSVSTSSQLDSDAYLDDDTADEMDDVIETYDTSLENKFPIWIRYKCPYCEFKDHKRYVVDDHVIIQHSLQGTSKATPKYGEALKQSMHLRIAKDNSLMTKFNEDILFENCLEESLENVELTQVITDDIDDLLDECDETEWFTCDATLPTGWSYSELKINTPGLNKIYMSPCDKRFNSRDHVVEFLLGQGKELLHPTGFKRITSEYTDCDGLCEGTCDTLVIGKKYFRDGDYNQIRKTTKLNFVEDEKHLKCKDKLVKGIPKKNAEVKGITYGIPSIRAERPWVIFIDENSQNQDNENQDTPLVPYGSKHDSEKPEKNKIKFEKFILGNQLEKSKESTKTKPIKESFITNESMSAKSGSKHIFNDKIEKQSLNINEKKDREPLLPLQSGESKKRDSSLSEHTGPPPKRRRSSSRESTPKSNRLGLIGFDLIYGIKERRESGEKKERRSSTEKKERRGSTNERTEDGVFEEIGEPSKRADKREFDSDSEKEQNKKRNIEKLKRLQRKEIEVNKNEGTYVQCCNDRCQKWRLVKEFEDPSMVPEYWVCTMNYDPTNNECGVGGHAFMSDKDLVDVKFTCGSMVWAKMKGFPWWPGMVDYCPDSEEYYWIEETISKTEPTWYNVVYFEGKGNEVSRAWIKADFIIKMTTPIQQPKSSTASKAGPLKNRLVHAMDMAIDAKRMTREERLEKYSFAALFKGKWGNYSDLEEDQEPKSQKKKFKPSGSQKKNTPKLRTKQTPEIIREDKDEHEDSEQTRANSDIMENDYISSDRMHQDRNGERFKTTINMPEKYKRDESLVKNDYKEDSEYKFEKKKKQESYRQSWQDDKSDYKKEYKKHEKTFAEQDSNQKPSKQFKEGINHMIKPIKYDKEYKKHEKIFAEQDCNQKPSKQFKEGINHIIKPIKYEKAKYISPVFSDDSDEDEEEEEEDFTLALEETPKKIEHIKKNDNYKDDRKRNREETNSPSFQKTLFDDSEIYPEIAEIKPEQLISTFNPNLDKNHPKPPLPSDVLIALAVRNLDPNNHYGASFSSIIAFLCLHFPYFNRNVEECKEMVRRAYDMDTKAETGKENFRIKGTLIPQLTVRIKSYVEKSKGMVKDSMLISEFLETLVQRFENGHQSNPACNFRPPYSCKMLSYLALISICPPSSMEQIMIFLKFLFPSLEGSIDKSAFKEEDFEESIVNDEYIEEYVTPTGHKMYVLLQGTYPEVLHQVRQFFATRSNNVRLSKSIYKPEFVDILLPNLTR